MDCVIEFHSERVIPKEDVGVACLKTANVICDIGSRDGGLQISVATGTGLIVDSRKAGGATMLSVAGRTIGCGDLRSMVSGAVVAIEAGGVSSFGGEGASALDVASCALFFEHRMGPRQAPAGIDAMVSRESTPGNPNERTQAKK